jgi:hypothetical protein
MKKLKKQQRALNLMLSIYENLEKIKQGKVKRDIYNYKVNKQAAA